MKEKKREIKMMKQVTTIDGELAIKLKKEDNLKFNDIVFIEKITKPKIKEVKK